MLLESDALESAVESDRNAVGIFFTILRYKFRLYDDLFGGTDGCAGKSDTLAHAGIVVVLVVLFLQAWSTLALLQCLRCQSPAHLLSCCVLT